MKNIYNTNSFDQDCPKHRKFYTKDGWLNKYALACGYVEWYNFDGGWISLELDGCYHVKQHGVDGHAYWETFRTWSGARNYFVKLIKLAIKKKRVKKIKKKLDNIF